MTLTLSSSDLARCEAVTRALLSPLAASSVDDWRRAVNQAMRELFRADYTLFRMPAGGGYAFSEELPAPILAGFAHYLEAPLAAGTPSEDPYVDLFIQRRIVQDLRVWDYGTIDRMLDSALCHSAFYNEVLLAGGVHGMLNLNARVLAPDGVVDAVLSVAYEHPRPGVFDGQGLLLLHALQPALRAGVEAHLHARAHLAALDALSEALFIADPTGRELHRNRALVCLLDADPEREQVLGALGFLALRLSRLSFPTAGRTADPQPFPPATGEVKTKHRCYRLRGTLLPAGSFGPAGALLITVEPLAGTPVLPSAEVLRTCYSLTRREAEVALLLAEGCSNDQLAERLFISSSTARRHTENVLGKLGLSSRKALALKFIQDLSAQK